MAQMSSESAKSKPLLDGGGQAFRGVGTLHRGSAGPKAAVANPFHGARSVNA